MHERSQVPFRPEFRAGLVAAKGKNKQEQMTRHMELLALFLRQEFTFAFR